MSELEERAKVCEVARTYLRTPYHHMGMVKGAGVDCLTFLIMVYSDAGLIKRFTPPFYSEQWFLHHSEELFMQGLLNYMVEIDYPPKPGDIAMFRVGRCFAHGSIIVPPGWPHIIHAHKKSGMVQEAEGDAEEFADLKKYPRKFFTMW